MRGEGRLQVHYRFAGFELVPDERLLAAKGKPVSLTPKVFDTLVMLVERAGHVVSKDELMAALWPRGFVNDACLAKHVWAIRKTLSQRADEPELRFVETVSKRGYRFVAPVEQISANPVADVGAIDRIGDAGWPMAAATKPAVHTSVRSPDPSAGQLTDRRRFDRRASDRDPVLRDSSARRARGWRWALLLTVIALLAVASFAAGFTWHQASSESLLSPSKSGMPVAIIAFGELSH